MPLRLGKAAKRKLKARARVRLKTRIAFTPAPHPGECVALYFKHCYSATFATSQTTPLLVKRPKKGKK